MSEYIYDINPEMVFDFVSLEGFSNAFLKNAKEEIVRCRDCKYHEPQTVVYSSKPLSVCTAEWCEGSEHDNPLVEPDGFCAWGERKNNE